MADVLLPGVCAPSIAAPCAPPMAAALSMVGGVQLPIVAPATLLGSALKAQWDSRVGTAATTWTDSITSAVLTATGSPVFGADGTNFNGLSVWQLVPTQGLNTGVLGAPLITAGAGVEFYFSIIVRQTAPAINQLLFTTLNGSSQAQFLVSQLSTGLGALSLLIDSTGQGVTYVPDTAVHRYEFGSWGAKRWFFVDSVQYASATLAPTTSRNLQRVCVPGTSFVSSNINIASIRAVSPVPTGQQLAQLRAYDRSVWGTL